MSILRLHVLVVLSCSFLVIECQASDWRPFEVGYKHNAEVTQVFVSKDYLISGDKSGVVMCGNHLGKLLRRVKFGESAITSICPCGDSRVLVCDRAGRVRIFNKGCEDVVREADVGEPIYSACWMSGAAVLGTENGKILIWARSGSVSSVLTFESHPVTSVSVIDSNTVGFANSLGNGVWSGSTSESSSRLLARASSPVYLVGTMQLEGSPRLVVTTHRGRVGLLETTSGKIEWKLRTAGVPVALSVASKRPYLVIATKEQWITLVELDEILVPRLTLLHVEPTTPAQAAAIDISGRRIVAGVGRSVVGWTRE